MKDSNKTQPILIVQLPEIVGSQWDELVKQHDTITDAINALITTIKAGRIYDELFNWFTNEKDSITILVQAALYGWKPEKKFILPMEATSTEDVDGDPGKLYAHITYAGEFSGDSNYWTTDTAENDKEAVSCFYTVSMQNIDNGPAWVKAIKPVEVTEDDD